MKQAFAPWLAQLAPCSEIALALDAGVLRVRLVRPARKHALTFAAYAHLLEILQRIARAPDVHAVLLSGDGADFCSGGDVHEIIGPLTQMSMPELLEFTRMTCAVVQAMLDCPQPIIALLDGVCAGAGAMLATAADLRLATPAAQISFLFNRVGLCGADMGACAMLPRQIGAARAAWLLYSGRSMTAQQGLDWGYLLALHAAADLPQAGLALATELAAGPRFAHAMTKKMLQQEWNLSLPQALEAEAQAQALCMATGDFKRAHQAFSTRGPLQFEGN
ncbi:enoyl-CoA hydratase family protein [Massilia sp. W12]|uniref:enoyl-CoA hydratase family protein n=1 Tax=Massilia sp. W12 TaxID=3126507 RepID=UPI0030CF3662